MIRIPPRLRQLMCRVPALEGLVLVTAAKCANFCETRPTFFPEYTDHSADHIEAVLRSADALISDTAYCTDPSSAKPEVMTPKDSVVLSLAIWLHDVGMHLTFDGFITLVGSEAQAGERRILIPYMDTRTWPEMWAEYLAETRRWDSRKRIAVFGEDATITDPPGDERRLTLRDRLLIGDFLRREHPRLAHEIAVGGFPGTNSRVSVIPADCPDNLHDLAGLVARSHGMPLRAAVESLKHFHKRDFQNVHAGFLMAVLRIADYLQVDSDRAPGQHLQVSTLKSPISRGEWKAHSAIRNISFEEEDPEAMYVDAHPPDVRTFLRLQHLLADLQTELDISWAVLGELYGRTLDYVG